MQTETVRSLLYWNIEGFRAASKLINLNALFDKYDVIALVETMLTNSVNIPNFSIIDSLAQLNPRGRPTGGISLAVKNGCNYKLINSTKNGMAIVISNICINIFYFSPNTALDEIFEECTKFLDIIPVELKTITIGDFNCRIDRPCERGKALTTFFYRQWIHIVE